MIRRAPWLCEYFGATRAVRQETESLEDADGNMEHNLGYVRTVAKKIQISQFQRGSFAEALLNAVWVPAY